MGTFCVVKMFQSVFAVMTHTHITFSCVKKIFTTMNCPAFPTEYYDPLLMGDDDMCNCHGVLGAGCIEGEGDCDNDEQCTEGLRCGDNNCRELITKMYQGPGNQHMDGYKKEVEEIFDEDDDCCYDPNNDSVILGASGIFNP